MAQRVKAVVNGVKRKAAEGAGPQDSAKRTRSSGVPPSHFVPLEGAPPPLKSINAFSPRGPEHVSPDKSKRKSMRTSQSRSRTNSHDLALDSINRSGSGSEDEIALQRPYKHPAHVASPQKNKFVAEVEIPARKLNPITYKRPRSRRQLSSPPASSGSDDELLLQSSPSKSTNTRAIKLPGGAPRSSSRTLRGTVQPSNHSSPIKQTRFLSPSPSDVDDGEALMSHETRVRQTSPNDAQNGYEDISLSNNYSTPRLLTPKRANPGYSSSNHRSPSKRSLSRNGVVKADIISTSLPSSPPSSKTTDGHGGVATSRRRLDDDTNNKNVTTAAQDVEGRPPRVAPLVLSTSNQNLSGTQATSHSDETSLGSPTIHPLPEQPVDMGGFRKNVEIDPPPVMQGSRQPPEQPVLPPCLAPELEPFLSVQKSVSLRLLHRPRQSLPPSPGATSGDSDVVGSLLGLLQGTVVRGEGNSCLVLGPRGSGKTTAVEEVISRLKYQADIEDDACLKPIVIRLSGHVHVNDRIALTEIGRQLIRQNGPSDILLSELENSENEIEETAEDVDSQHQMHFASLMPPPSQMSSLVTTMSTLPRPTIVVLDAFDLFTAHARQALLYCLLDTVQSCRAGQGRKGVAVVGVTTRVDTLNLLEKRVKSRFSHRIIKCPSITSLDAFITTVKTALTRTFTLEEAADLAPPRVRLEPQALEKWETLWTMSVESCLVSRETKRVLKENFELTRDVCLLNNVLASALLATTPASPWLLPSMLGGASRIQRAPDQWSFLSACIGLPPDLPFPALALLVASFHLQTWGHDTFTFEHAFHTYSRATRQSTSTNISLDGVVIGLPKVSREVMAGAFEDLISCKVFQPSGASSASTSFQFKKYRCCVSRLDVKAAIEVKAHTQLKRWLSRPT